MKKKYFLLFCLIQSLIFSQNAKVLRLNESLKTGSSLSSNNSIFKLVVDSKSIYLKGEYKNCIKWSEEFTEGSELVLNDKGLVEESTGKVLILAPGSKELRVDDSGNLTFYDQNDNVLWTSGTTDIVNYKNITKNKLSVGESLQAGEYLISKSNQFKLHFGKDGNLLLLGVVDAMSCNPKVLWQSGTAGKYADKLTLNDNSLVLTKDGITIFEQSWSTGFASELLLSDENGLVVENAGDVVLWQPVDNWKEQAEIPVVKFFDELNDKCAKLSYNYNNSMKEFSLLNNPSEYYIYINKNHLGNEAYALYNKNNSILSTNENGESLILQSVADSNSYWMIEDLVDGNSFSGKGYLRNTINGKYLSLAGENSFGLNDSRDMAAILTIDVQSPENCWYLPVDLAAKDTSVLGMTENQLTVTSELGNGSEVLYGAIDAHAHTMAASYLGGVAYHGKMFSWAGILDPKLAILDALPDSFRVHGPQGVLNFFKLIDGGLDSPFLSKMLANITFWDEKFWTEMPERLFEKNIELVEELMSGEFMHMYSTAGYPFFTHWPAYDKNSNQRYYYEWLNRARMGGLKMLNILAVESKGGCKLLRFGYSVVLPIDPLGLFIQQPDCDRTEMSVINEQLDEIDQLEDYIKRVDGGWLQVVSNPEEARSAIRQGKLAVMKGIETPALFDCINWAWDEEIENLLGDYGIGRKPCTPAYIDEQVKILKDKRVSFIYPLHHYNNDFGGAESSVAGGAVEILQFAATGKAIEAERCYRTGEGLNQVMLKEGDFLSWVLKMVVGPIAYESKYGWFYQFPMNIGEGGNHFVVDKNNEPGWCNSRGLTDIGEYLLIKLMENGILIDFDHMSHKTQVNAYQILEKYDYPIVSGHFDRMNTIKENVKVALSGQPINFKSFEKGMSTNILTSAAGSLPGGPEECPKPTSISVIKNIVGKSNENKNGFYNLPAYTFSSDESSVASIAPRFEEGKFKPNFGCVQDPATKLRYPFKSFDGKYVFNKMRSGFRTFDYNTGGLSTIGQFPDMIADMQAMGFTDEDIAPIFRGAELFVRVWEEAVKASALVRNRNKTFANDELKVQIYPTQVDNSFNLKNDSNGALKVSIYDENGVMVDSLMYGAEQDILVDNLSHLSKGVYFVYITDESEQKRKSISIIKN